MAQPIDLGIVSSIYKPCVVPSDDDFNIDLPTSIPANGRDIKDHVVNGEHIWSSWDTKHGYILKKYGKDQVLVQNRGTNSHAKNLVMLYLDDNMAGTPYYWIDKNGACLVSVDYSRVSGGYAYGLKRFGG